MPTRRLSLEAEYRDSMLLPPSADRHVIVVVDRKGARLFDVKMSGGMPQRVSRCGGEGPALLVRLTAPMGRPPVMGHRGLMGALRNARTILVVGHGPGAAEAVAALLAELRKGRGDLVRRVRSTVVRFRPTECQLVLLARSLAIAEGLLRGRGATQW